MPSATKLRIKRVYLPAGAEDGLRVLVDRLWPRGLSRSAAAIALWVKDVAPGNDLRKWFNHQPERWARFRELYLDELRNNPEPVEKLLDAMRGHPTVTLLFAARDEQRNNAIVLKEFLENLDLISLNYPVYSAP